ncbi:hypothetical protein [Paraburkholderia sp. UCT2]|uniref:hypothetical protein n=1 Tax=Paraburkholderia sp. UCT2 TaxID=2615208 RepID=UPI001654EB17|nr:hypothetical protein [Paraburkholderia sp. UCT2]MBC8732971.1 hypothetical protein [Paraburkholderia sp. UCT2]
MPSTVKETSGSGEEWWKATENDMVIRGRRTVDDFVAVTWTGRAEPPRIETFLFDEAVGRGQVRAVAWTEDSLIETDSFSHAGGVSGQLAGVVRYEDLTFIKLQAGDYAERATGLVAWSKLVDDNVDREGHADPRSEWDYPDRYADVGVLLPRGELKTLEPHIADFIGSTYIYNEKAEPGIESIRRVLRSLVDALNS